MGYVIDRRFNEGASWVELAWELDVSVERVRQLYKQGIRNLRKNPIRIYPLREVG